ncbi:MAG: hypothetical protein CML02_02395 [Pseudooceanicola sp.]|nr:hypothetical protein [Pseudooceanicola sp.]
MNNITVRRKTLAFEDAVTVHVMRLQGVSYTDIVQSMGTNANRIGEVLRGEVHPDTAMKALRLLTH